MNCKSCGAELDLSMAVCPSCGVELQMGRLTGVLGIVCRNCDAYNEPAAKRCSSCGQPLGAPPVAETPSDASAGGEPAAPAKTPPPVTDAIPNVTGDTDTAVPLQPGNARLVLERGEGFDGAVYRLNAPQVAVGRSRGAVVFPSDNTLASHHATFLYRDGSLHLRDEGAPGGVYLRLRDLSVPLKVGDLFVVGDRLLRFGGPLPPPPPTPTDGVWRLGSPRPPAVAILIEEWLESGHGGRVFLRPGPSVTIGRAGCSINIDDDPFLSQAHAEIAIGLDGSAKLRDLGSSNGTFIRIPSHAERELRVDDVVRIGREVLRVVAG